MTVIEFSMPAGSSSDPILVLVTGEIHWLRRDKWLWSVICQGQVVATGTATGATDVHDTAMRAAQDHLAEHHSRQRAEWEVQVWQPDPGYGATWSCVLTRGGVPLWRKDGITTREEAVTTANSYRQRIVDVEATHETIPLLDAPKLGPSEGSTTET